MANVNSQVNQYKTKEYRMSILFSYRKTYCFYENKALILF